MVTYVDADGRVAFVTRVDSQSRSWALGIYEAWEAMLACKPTITEHVFAGTPNAVDAELALGPGWTVVVRNDSDWSVMAESEERLPAERSVPPSVTARQIRLWLVRHGVSLAAVDAAIDAIPDQQQRDEVRVEWDYAPYVERSHHMLLPLAAALGLTAAQVDDAFREAETL